MERPSRHAKLGVRNGEIVGDRGGLFCASAAKQPLAAQAGRSFRRLCSETIPRKGRLNRQGLTPTPSHDAVLIGGANDKTVSGVSAQFVGRQQRSGLGNGGQLLPPTAGVTFPARDTTAHGRYEGMRRNSTNR